MGTIDSHIIFVVDRSNTDKSTLAAIKEAIKEIMEDLNGDVSKVSLIHFSNFPKISEEPVVIEKIDKIFYDKECGGMCNVHIALAEACKLIDPNQHNATCVVLFLASDPADSFKVLKKSQIDVLEDSEKFLIKRNSNLLEPLSFHGRRAYVLGVERDTAQLIKDIKESLNDPGNVDIPADNIELNQENDQDNTSSYAKEKDSKSLSSSKMDEETELDSPDIVAEIYN